jgi:hypothetical protein
VVKAARQSAAKLPPAVRVPPPGTPRIVLKSLHFIRLAKAGAAGGTAYLGGRVGAP